MSDMSERIKLLRERKGMTQDDLAERLGMNRANISNYERGIVTNIPADVLNKMADLFGTTVDYVLGRTNDTSSSEPTVEEFDEEVRALARDIQHLESDNKDLLKAMIKTMQARGREARNRK